MTRTVVVLAKEPRPGYVKTRLVPPLTHGQAAALAASALHDTLDAMDDVAADDRILAFAGDARDWLRPAWQHVAQPPGGLDERIVAAFAASRGPTVLIGMDTPQVRAQDVEAFDPQRYDACLGHARDGGFWAIGFADPGVAGAAVSGVPMSTTDTGRQQLDRLRRLGLRVQLLHPMTDVDTIDTAHEVALVAPHTRFATALAATMVGV